MANDPRDIVNDVLKDEVVSGSATVLTTENRPGKVVVKLQIIMPPRTSPQTLLFPLEKADARQLQQALSKCLAGTSH